MTQSLAQWPRPAIDDRDLRAVDARFPAQDSQHEDSLAGINACIVSDDDPAQLAIDAVTTDQRLIRRGRPIVERSSSTECEPRFASGARRDGEGLTGPGPIAQTVYPNCRSERV